MHRFLILLLLWPASVGAQARGEPGFACLIERLDLARAACLGVEADRVETGTQALLARATGDLQALSAQEIIAYEAALRSSQQRWRAGVVTACRLEADGDRVVFARCRLEETVARADLVAKTLDEARENLGAPALTTGPDIPDSVEILIPLPAAPGGPDAPIRVPIEVPLP